MQGMPCTAKWYNYIPQKPSTVACFSDAESCEVYRVENKRRKRFNYVIVKREKVICLTSRCKVTTYFSFTQTKQQKKKGISLRNITKALAQFS